MTPITIPITVLMPIFNVERYLDEAIKSILNQTFKDFELLIINDGSTDKSADIVKKYRDKRIKFINNHTHQGLVAVLNQGMALARGVYLARMDGDDISLPTRLEKQLKFMDSHPDVGVCGTWFEVFGLKLKNRVYSRPANPMACKAMLLFTDPVCHATVIMRPEMLKKHHLKFDPSFKHLEDVEFWNRVAKFMDFSNIEEVLYLYRYHDNRTGNLYENIQQMQMKRVQTIYLKKMGITSSEKYIDLHWQILTRRFHHSRDFLMKARRWLLKMITTNRKSLVYDPMEFQSEVWKKWSNICRDSSSLGLWVFREYWNFPGAFQSKREMGLITFLFRCTKASILQSVSIAPVLPLIKKASWAQDVMVWRSKVLWNNIIIKLS